MDRGVIAISDGDSFEKGEFSMAEEFGITVEELHRHIEEGTALQKGTRYYYFDYVVS